MSIVKKVRNAVYPFECHEHYREVLAIDETLPPAEQERQAAEIDRKYRPARWR